MRNRNDELEPDPDAGFDMDAWEEENMPAEEHKDSYEDYECYELEVTETVVKTVSVFAKDPESAKKYLETFIDDIDMKSGIDEYKKTVTVAEECGKSTFDYTVPLWWYE